MAPQPRDPFEARPEGGGFAPLSPIGFLLRSARVFAERAAVRDGDRTLSYAELLEQAERLAGALCDAGVTPGERVALLLPNVPEMLLAHYAGPGIGAAVVPINTRLNPSEVAYILEHSGARVLLSDANLGHVARAALAELGAPPRLLEVGGDGSVEAAMAAATPRPLTVPDERTLLSVNYTSGTTGRPKGVMYTHRGAFLQSLGVIAQCSVTSCTRYLWTLPMFHCHGWSFTWAITAMGGRHVCLRQVAPGDAWRAMAAEEISHLCGAPTVLDLLLGAPEAAPRAGEPVRVFTGGAPPTPTLIERCEALGWEVTHLYGLTETYGPIGVCVWHPEWDALAPMERARLRARQGVESVVSQPLRVVDEHLADVPADGASLGELVMSGNNVTIGYFRDKDATARAFAGGVFHSGDLGVVHPDGYVEIRDRLKDVIISGGENISSIEVEQALAAHPDIAQVAVVGVPHEKWGETPCAVVVPRAGAELTLQDLRAFARDRLAGYKLPGRLTVVEELPTTSTGKVQKFRLRELVGAEEAPGEVA